MTQPTYIDMTFDTSLVDVNAPANANVSFSTTESDSTVDGQQTSKCTQNLQPTMASQKPSASVQHIPTQAAYDQWAAIYDTDGNMLQAIDDLELQTLLPDFLSQVKSSTATEQEVRVLDLGCGTGRNTEKLVRYDWNSKSIQVIGLDFSQGMLDIAAKKLSPLLQEKEQQGVQSRLECCDCFPTVDNPSASPLPAVSGLRPVHAVTSTLVLEHIPLQDYFATLAALLLPGGTALVTNMHADMGRVSQAGFVNADGVKVRGSSYVYTVEETAAAARDAGLEVASVNEREMRKEDVEGGAVGERGWKWVGTNVWFGMVFRRAL
jgi:SAM-dependent methyltransferase